MPLRSANYFKTTKFYGIDWHKALGTCQFALQNASFFDRFRLAVRAICGFSFLKPRLPSKIETEFLFFKSISRLDYDLAFDRIVGSCQHPKAALSPGRYVGLNAWAAFAMVIYLRVFARLLLSNRDLFASVYLYVNLLRSVYHIEIFKKYRFSALVVFADMQLVESALVQYFRRFGVVTVTLQHGLYIDNIHENNCANINAINLLNIVAEYFLAWGENTRRLVQKYSNAKVRVVGKCRDRWRRDPNVAAGRRFIAVIFDSEVYREYNIKLLAISTELARLNGCQLQVRFHPDNHQGGYALPSDLLIDSSEPIQHCWLALAHITSFQYEAMRSGIPVFKLRSPIPCHVLPDEVCFSDLEELQSKVGKGQDFEQIGREFVFAVSPEAEVLHSNFFDSISRKKPA
jgi:hypothetical protein